MLNASSVWLKFSFSYTAQCFVFGCIYVKSGNQFCNSRPACSCQPIKVSVLSCLFISLTDYLCYYSPLLIFRYNCFMFRVRMHYGHPDVFDRVFHITRGGISKASRIINISEDIFAGWFFDQLLSEFCSTLFKCCILYLLNLASLCFSFYYSSMESSGKMYCSN